MLLFSASILELSCWCIVALWSVYLTLLVLGLKRRQVLSAETSITLPRSIPRVTVLVSARNEEADIARCLLSLTRQDYPNFEVIAINDRSTDATGEIMDWLADEFSDTLRVVHIDTLPTGWLGKTHAMHVGSQSATGEWLLYVDADCEVQSASAISLAVQEAQRRGVDMLSLTPQFILNTAWEKITVPVCSALMMVWFQPARVNNPRLPTSYANGAFLMMSRYCYDSVGGWCRFRTEVSEDIAIARAAKTSGLKLAVLQNDGIYRTCMYDSIRDSWRGWSRIFYGALPQKALALSFARLIICSLIPTWGLVIGLTAYCCGTLPNEWYGIMAAATAAVVLQQVYSALISRAVGGSLLWSFAAPIGHLALAGMLMRALMNHLGMATTQWSGMIIRRGELVTTPRPQAPALSIHSPQAR